MNTLKLKERYLSIYSVMLVVILMLSQINDSTLLISVLFIGTALLLFNPLFMLPVFLISSLGNNFFAYDGVSISRIVGFMLIVGCLMTQIREGTLIKKRMVLTLLVFLIYSFISSTFSITGSFYSFVGFSQILIIVFFLGQFRNVDLNNLSWMIITASSITIILFLFWFKENFIELSVQRLSVSEGSSINRLATMFAQLIAIVFAGLFISGKSKLTNIIFVSIMLLGLSMIVLTGTRSALIAIIVSIVIITFYYLKKFTMRIAIYLPLIFLLGYLFVNQIEQLDSSLLERFTVDKLQDDGGSGRLNNWKTLVPKTIEDGLFFGFGFGAENSYYIANLNGLRYSAHNFLIDMFIQMGLTGLILFLTYFYSLAKKLVKSIDNPHILVPVMILLTGVLNGVGETVFLEKFFWNGIALGWLYLNNVPNTFKMSKQTYKREAHEPV